MQKPNICLNMIVKNEAHCIEETLTSIAKYIDYYVISDTGSEDNTQQVIINFFSKLNIPGEIHQNPWVSFDHNRTLALELCKNKSNYIWVIDADDLIIGNLILPSPLIHDSYSLIFGNEFTYQRTQIFKNTPEFKWYYVGVVHEYPACSKATYTDIVIPGDYYIDSRRLGSRNKVGNKYLRDAELLEKDLLKNPNNDRTVFYLAQSYFDAGLTEKGIETYKKRIAMKSWPEEVYYSYLRIGDGLKILNKPWEEVEKAYLDCYNYMPQRAEPLFRIMKHYRDTENHELAYKYGKLAINIKYPSHLKLFIDKNIYEYETAFELSICSYYIGKYEESYQLSHKLLTENKINKINLVKSNILFSENMLRSLKNKRKLCLHFDEHTPNIDSLIKNLSTSYDVTIIGNYSKYQFHNTLIINDINLISDTTFDYFISFNSITCFYEQHKQIHKINSHKKILYLNTNFFNIHVKNGLSVSIIDEQFLNNILDVNTIVFESQEHLTSFIKNCNLNLSNIQIFNLFQDVYYCSILDHTPQNQTKFILPTQTKYIVNEPHHTNDKQHTNLLKKYYKKTISYFSSESSILTNEIKLHLLRFYNKHSLFKQFDKLLSNTTINESETELFNKFLYEKIKYFHHHTKYDHAYSLLSNLLQNSTPENPTEAITIRDSMIPFIKHKYLSYPSNIISTLKNKPNPKIMLTMTTCKRFDLFEKTVNSFLNCCQDISQIDHFLCVDDNSSLEDRSKMQTQYPFFEYINKNESEKGHYISMNIIHKKILQYEVDYVIHLEDDWHFIEERPYITDSCSILNENPKIGQVLFNLNYAEVERTLQEIRGGIPSKTKSGKEYILHEHHKPGTPEYINFVNKYGSGMCSYWPHFSFRPSLIRSQVFKDIGIFINTPHFELQYSKEYFEHGYISSFLNTISCLHTGKKTWESNGLNSYNLNNTNQFYFNNQALDIQIISSNIQTWKTFKQMASSIFPTFSRKEITNIKQLDELQKKMFYKNNFNYNRKIINLFITFIEVIKDSQSDHIFLLFDGNEINTDIYDRVLERTKSVFDITKIDNGYLISKSGINKVREYVEKLHRLSLDQVVSQKLNVINKGDFFQKFNFDNFNEEILFKHDNIIQFEGYTFYSNMDSYGFDIGDCRRNISLEELKKIADENEECCGFNTYGYIKYQICGEENFIYLWNSAGVNDGLYVKN